MGNAVSRVGDSGAKFGAALAGGALAIEIPLRPQIRCSGAHCAAAMPAQFSARHGMLRR